MTAVELLRQDLDAEIKLGTKMVVNWDMYIEIEKQQIIDAYDAGLFDGTMDDVNDRMHKQYYNETYGSKGSVFLENYEQINQDNPVTSGSTALVNVTSSQTEISDEEIEKAAKECVYEDLDISAGSFELGARWYREQLKQLL